MSRCRLWAAFAILAIAYLGLSSCGQMGPLTLPEQPASDDGDNQDQDGSENER